MYENQEFWDSVLCALDDAITFMHNLGCQHGLEAHQYRWLVKAQRVSKHIYEHMNGGW